jgi:tetratricopeptide (TPR) repeat protein
MELIVLLELLLLGAVAPGPGDGGVAAPAASVAPTYAFVHVNVVPMDRERILADQIVVTRDGAVAALGDAASTPIPAGATVVDAHGAFLLPGFADLHTHAQHEDDLFLYVSQGVTTTLNLGLARSTFVTQTRARVAAGELIAPACFVAPLMNGPRGSDLPCATVEEAKRSVDLAHELGYEFIKVYNDLSTPLFHALCDEAHACGMAVVGHGVRAPGLQESFEAGQVMVAHAEEYLYTLLLSGRAGGAGVDASKIPEAVALTKEHDVFVVPNLSAYAEISRQWGKPDVVTGFLERPEIAFMRPFWRRAWRASDYAQRGGNLDGKLDFLRGFTKALHDGGVRLLLGTDSPDIPGVESGFSIHDDLAQLVASGLTPFQALECGTRIAGEFIGEFVPDAEPFGTIDIGQRADLLLVEKNPLEDVANVKGPLGVMVRGRWLPREELVRRLDEMKTRFAKMEACERAFLDEGAKSGFVAACERARRDRAGGAEVLLDEGTLGETATRLLRENGKRDDALALLGLDSELHPKSADAFERYGQALALADRNDEARASLSKALALDPKNPAAKRALAAGR